MITVDIAKMDSVKNAALFKIQKYITNAIEINKKQIAFTIEHRGKNETPEQIISYYVDYLISHAFSNYDKEQLLELISSGVVFTARDLFIDQLINEKTIYCRLDC
jgi:hypothetical protein